MSTVTTDQDRLAGITIRRNRLQKKLRIFRKQHDFRRVCDTLAYMSACDCEMRHLEKRVLPFASLDSAIGERAWP